MAKMLCIRSAAPNRFHNGLESGRVYEVNAHPQQCACTGQEARAAAEGAVFNRKTRVNRQCCGTKIAMVYVPWGMSRFVPRHEAADALDDRDAQRIQDTAQRLLDAGEFNACSVPR